MAVVVLLDRLGSSLKLDALMLVGLATVRAMRGFRSREGRSDRGLGF
jgi:hypothetical protein